MTRRPRSDPRPVNIAHRGASAYAPEHTVEAYALAIAMHADFVEQDLQVTRDGVLVCLHDATLERTTDVARRFPERSVPIVAAGPPRVGWPVAGFDLDEMARLDAGSWFDPRFAGARVPTFQDAIDIVRGRAGLYVETKTPESYRARGLSMEERLIEILAANGLDTPAGRTQTPVVIQSFSPGSLRLIRALAGSAYRLIQLVGAEHADLLLGDAGLETIAGYADGIGPAVSLLLGDPTRVTAARRHGLDVHPYTVRTGSVPPRFPDATVYMRYLCDELGATGVFTDHPDLFPTALRTPGSGVATGSPEAVASPPRPGGPPLVDGGPLLARGRVS